MKSLLKRGKELIVGCRNGEVGVSQLGEYGEEVKRALSHSDMDTDAIALRSFYESSFLMWFARVTSNKGVA